MENPCTDCFAAQNSAPDKTSDTCAACERRINYCRKNGHDVVPTQEAAKPEGVHVCPKCKVEKPISEFYRDNRAKSGFKTTCKKCELETKKAARMKSSKKNIRATKARARITKIQTQTQTQTTPPAPNHWLPPEAPPMHNTIVGVCLGPLSQGEIVALGPELVIIRGLPGSGKTTLAKERFQGYLHYEPDHLWSDIQGRYRFDAQIRDQVEDLVRVLVDLALARGESVVVADVFLTRDSILPYQILADHHKAAFRVIHCRDENGSTHRVPRFVINRMARDFELWENEEIAE